MFVPFLVPTRRRNFGAQDDFTHFFLPINIYPHRQDHLFRPTECLQTTVNSWGSFACTSLSAFFPSRSLKKSREEICFLSRLQLQPEIFLFFSCFGGGELVMKELSSLSMNICRTLRFPNFDSTVVASRLSGLHLRNFAAI